MTRGYLARVSVREVYHSCWAYVGILLVASFVGGSDEYYQSLTPPHSNKLDRRPSHGFQRRPIPDYGANTQCRLVLV